MDLSEFSSITVRAVVKIFYTGSLSYPASKKLNVFKLIKHFDLENDVLKDLYDFSVL